MWSVGDTELKFRSWAGDEDVIVGHTDVIAKVTDRKEISIGMKKTVKLEKAKAVVIIICIPSTIFTQTSYICI